MGKTSSRIRGRIHSIDTFTALDGPGIRTVVFMQGCHLRCKYCHNPDTWNLCSSKAREYTVEHLMKIIERGLPYFNASGGGITFSGGEPLLQAQFLKEVFASCKEKQISTAFDSSLYVSCDIVKEVLSDTDLVLADIKHINNEKSIALTGMSNKVNLENLLLIDQYKVSMWIRYVVVPGWTDDKEDIEEMARFLAGLKSVDRIDLLPYHSLGIHKWQMMGMEYHLKNVSPPEESYLEEIANLLEENSGKRVIIR